ncbi:TetR/AcrR family transcriptional regulator [Microaerobacter geothermalis]|uniref:TetR/AcrR family transcriptional regulator n=1 Tax=Microaerobacter geothermalis TaxID=674972 RepID=UPI001F2009A6|nr:TetR/AcrR family transcriptional regulator [Microaerobacter geothermalis]MCF6095054.1 TetR/AcrR family transcriptional regulator [Microaerobacter geothermalis]
MALNTLDKIYQGGFKAFAQKGYFEVTMEEVAVIAGVSKGTLYYRFKTKEELYFYLIERGIDEFCEAISNRLAEIPLYLVEERLDALVRVHLHYFESHPDFCKLMFRRSFDSFLGEDQFLMKMKDYFYLIEKELTNAQEKGWMDSFLHITTAASSFFGMLGFFVIRTMVRGDSIRSKPLQNTLIHMVKESMRAK